MNRLSPPLFYLTLLSLFFQFNDLPAQMDRWVLYPNEIDFDSGTVSEANFNAATPYKVENAVYSNGEMLFYVQDGAVYDSSGNFVFSFGYDYTMLKEIAVAPLPGSCDTWCLFWLEAYPLTTLEFHFQEVKVVDGAIVPGSGGLIIAPVNDDEYRVKRI